MHRHILFVLLLLCGQIANSQPYNNEWIDPAKTYYKFPLRTSQLCRIPKTTLVGYGLGDIPAEQFQLWRNGKEVPLYTTQATGALAADGYLEFYGKLNDGEADQVLYPDPSYQPNITRSLFTDTAWYFLTINAGPNARLVPTANNVASTTLKADSFFNHRQEQLFPQGFSEGFCILSGFNDEVPYSGTGIRTSSFNKGEGWYYAEFRKSAPATINLNNLRVYPKSTSIKLEYKASGWKGWSRNALIYMNDSLLSTDLISSLDMISPSIDNIPLSRITNNNSTSIKLSTDLDDKFWWDPDRNIIHSLILSYQRSFNFNLLSLFEFSLQGKADSNHLRISNFNNQGLPAVLYDLTNKKRYLSTNKPDTSMYLLEPSLVKRDLVIFNQHSSRVTTIANFKEVHFPDLAQMANQGDYLIISSNRLYDYNGINYVEAYRAYRSSIAGGSYNAKIYEVDVLADMFAFGIRKNPLAVKNFIRYAHDQFTKSPKYVFLIGRGSRYIDYRVTGFAQKDLLNAVPTYGMPASDNMLGSADNVDATPLIPLGRLAVVNGKEINDYLQKVKELEALDNFAEPTPENKDWKKNVIQLIGGDDDFLSQVIGNFMGSYKKTISDSLMGAQVNTYTRVNNSHFAEDLYDITKRINAGVGFINYFGHSSSSSIDFAMNSPFEYENTNGKYPVFMANGCRAGNLFDFNGNRLVYYGQSISDKFIFAPKRGAVAFISNSDLGVLNYMHLFTSEWHISAGKKEYGKGIGDIQRAAIGRALAITGFQDYFNLQNCEQVLLHGDPAIVLNPTPKPDYTPVDSLVTVTPLHASVAEDTLLVKATFANIGKSTVDSVWAEIKREYPDGRVQSISKVLFRKLFQSDSLTAKIPVKGMFDQGTNYIIASIDPANEWAEMSETNNEVRIPFEVSDEEIRPVYPYAFSIMNQTGFLLTGSTVNAVQDERTYRLQLDTTEAFNSPLLYQKDTVTIGGAVSFNPSITWENGRVYYWRLAPVFNGQPVNWRSSSFQYLQGLSTGWGQSHFYQHQKSNFVETKLGADRLFQFGTNIQSLYILNSINGFSGDEDNHFSITVNGVQFIRSACVGRSIIFNVFDTLTFKPWDNSAGYRFGSGYNCGVGREYNFEFTYANTAGRKLMMDFLDSIPKGLYVTARLILDADRYANGTNYFDSSFTKYWQKDTLIYGSGKSLYHSLLRQGFYAIDSVNDNPRTFLFAFRKDDSSAFKPTFRISSGLYDRIDKSLFPETVDTVGAVWSPKFGPSKKWKEMHWMGHQFPGIDPESDAMVQIIGIDNDNNETVLKSYLPSQWVNDISDIDADVYPYLQLKLSTKNSIKAIPYQLDYWRLFYDPVPDGALSARDHFVFSNPILLTGKDSLKIELAFKNISRVPLAATNATIKIGDRNGIVATYPLNKLKALFPQDTAIISFKKETVGMDGKYYALIEVNKEQNPLEQYSFNNVTYLPFEVATSLPVTVVNFDAKAGQNQTVLLSWNVTNELDVLNYDLEFGTSSNKLNLVNKTVAFNAGGNHNYTWLHTKPVIGVNYYRLKTTYKDGRIEYSPIRQVVFGKNGLISMYPNPFHEKIWVNVPGNQQWTLDMYNAAGQKMMTKTGVGMQAINTQSLPAGLYMVRISSGSDIQTLKLEKRGL